MKKGEKYILGGIALAAVLAMVYKATSLDDIHQESQEVPFYSTADKELADFAADLVRRHKCRDCHVFWAKRNIMQAVPAPALDGIGSLRDEEWLFQYLSAENPQSILPSRLKPQFRMPSFAFLEEGDRRRLANYLSSLKAKDWYLEEAKRLEYEKLTGKDYQP
jgi:hypothetical protein